MTSNIELKRLADQLVQAVKDVEKDGTPVHLKPLRIYGHMKKPPLFNSAVRKSKTPRCSCGKPATYMVHMHGLNNIGDDITRFVCTNHSMELTRFTDVTIYRKEDHGNA